VKSLILHMAGTALTANRSTPSLAGMDLVDTLTVYNAEIMYAGGMAAVDYLGEVQMAANTAGLRVVGRVKEYVDNTADGKKATVERGIFRYTNSSSYPIVRTAIGTVCYVEDDNIVAGYASNLVPAGLVHDVDSTGVWVDQSALALAYARRFVAPVLVEKTDNYTCTAAIAYEGRTYFSCSKAGGMEITLPAAWMVTSQVAVAVPRCTPTRMPATASRPATASAPPPSRSTTRSMRSRACSGWSRPMRPSGCSTRSPCPPTPRAG
jgi:hypothetical protein